MQGRLRVYSSRLPGILLAGGTRGMRAVCVCVCVMSESDWLGPGVRWLPLTPRACRRIWGIGLSRRLPRTRHARAP